MDKIDKHFVQANNKQILQKFHQNNIAEGRIFRMPQTAKNAG
jgi:hypothetical protein